MDAFDVLNTLLLDRRIGDYKLPDDMHLTPALRMYAFLRFRPDALIDFSPDRPVNVTPRSWAAVRFHPRRRTP